MAITQITVGVKRLIALAKYENVTYSVEATATVAASEAPIKVYEDTLAFCQDKIIKEMERMEAGLPPKRPSNPLNEDEIPNFKPQGK
jgi:hypothetical protein